MGISIEEPANTNSSNKFSLFATGFRVFFLLAGISAIFLVYTWISEFSFQSMISHSGKSTMAEHYGSIVNWHAHEMLFGYTVAVIAGFLLTAAGNWTGLKIVNIEQLMFLSVLWIAARIAPFIPDLQGWPLMILDLSFLPFLALFLALPIIKARQWNNIVFVPLLLMMTLANAVVHLGVSGLINIDPAKGNMAMLYLVIFLITFMGGRVIPFFTERGVGGVTTRKWSWLEKLAPLSLLILAIADVVLGYSNVTGSLAILAGLIHLVRLSGWYSNKIWQVPMVWILQVSYFWIILGFLILSLQLFQFTIAYYAYHAFTVGGIGIMTLGMMTRVTLGHTGREMKPSRFMVLAFVLMNIVAIIRVILPMFDNYRYLDWINYSGLLWIIVFILFTAIHLNIWIRPRVDGREG